MLRLVGNNPSADDSGVSSWKSSSATASARNELNGSKTSGAPQQAVVNSWHDNDLANVQISQSTYTAVSSFRNGRLLGLLVLGLTGELLIPLDRHDPVEVAARRGRSGDWRELRSLKMQPQPFFGNGRGRLRPDRTQCRSGCGTSTIVNSSIPLKSPALQV